MDSPSSAPHTKWITKGFTMEVTTVESSDYPEAAVQLQGSTIVTFDVHEVIVEDLDPDNLPSIKYVYKQTKLPANSSEVAIQKVVTEGMRSLALAEYEQSVIAMVGEVPSTEIASWPKQEGEARAYIADPGNAVTPLLEGLVSARGLGETVEGLSLSIISKADSYAVGLSSALGKYQAKTKALALE